jgi:hypothetical protein
MSSKGYPGVSCIGGCERTVLLFVSRKSYSCETRRGMDATWDGEIQLHIPVGGLSGKAWRAFLPCSTAPFAL